MNWSEKCTTDTTWVRWMPIHSFSQVHKSYTRNHGCQSSQLVQQGPKTRNLPLPWRNPIFRFQTTWEVLIYYAPYIKISSNLNHTIMPRVIHCERISESNVRSRLTTYCIILSTQKILNTRLWSLAITTCTVGHIRSCTSGLAHIQAGPGTQPYYCP